MKKNVTDAIRTAKDRYGDASAGVRMYVSMRCAFGGYKTLLRNLPETGNILDFGCGYGQLSIIAHIASGERALWGYDISCERLGVAKKAAEGLEGVSFCAAEFELPDVKWSAVVFVDSLHYVPPAEQTAIVARYAEKVTDGGMLLIRDVSAAPGPKFATTRLHETLMVSTGLTPTREKTSYFRNIMEFVPALEAAGFETIVHPPAPLHPYADYLLVARKTRAAVR